MPVELAHHLAAVLMTKVERDVAIIEPQHVSRVPAEVIARRELQLDVAESRSSSHAVSVMRPASSRVPSRS